MAGGFLRGGMRPAGRGRESSMKKSGSDSPMPMRHNPIAASTESGSTGGGEETKIVHHPDGQHEVHHADGEVTKHPSAGHMAAHLHARHSGGQAGNMESDGMGGPVKTHIAGADGEVSGPDDHATPEDGAAHLAQAMSGGMDNEGSEPDGDEYGAGFAG